MEVLLERALHRHLDRRALLPLPTLGGYFVDTRWTPRRRIGFLEPLLEQRFQFAHIFKTELQSLESAYRRLREDVSVERAERETDVRLREAELYAALFELFGESFQVVAGGRVLLGLVALERVVVVQRVRRGLHVAQHVVLVHGHRVAAVQRHGRAGAVVRGHDGRVPAVALQVAVVVRRGGRLDVGLVRVRVVLVHGPGVGGRQRRPGVEAHGRARRGRAARVQVVLVLHIGGLGAARRGSVVSTDAAEIQLSRHIRGRRHGAVPQIHGGRRLAGSKALKPSPGALFRETSASNARRLGSGGGHLTSPDSTTSDMRVRARRRHGADWARGGGGAPRAGPERGGPAQRRPLMTP